MRRSLVANQGGTIHHFSASGVDLGAFASGLSSPSWITTDQSGNIYVSEYGGGKASKTARPTTARPTPRFGARLRRAP